MYRELDYINFLIAAQRTFSAVEAAKSRLSDNASPAHDTYTRLLQHIPPDSDALWQEVEPLVERTQGVLIVDDSTLDKPYASKMALVTRHWSGKHRRVVQGINLISLVWADGKCRLPCDYRLYHKTQDGLSKNDHFRQMIQQAKARGFAPELVAFDSWYAGLKNLKLVRASDWDWLTQLKSNRQVSIDRSGNRAIREVRSCLASCSYVTYSRQRVLMGTICGVILENFPIYGGLLESKHYRLIEVTGYYA